MKEAVAYIRCSTPGQVTEGVSLETQRAKIEAWAALHDFHLVATFDDAGISGKSANGRPGLQAALKLACETKAAVVVYSLSRLARSTKDAINISERLEHAKADLVSVTESIDTTTAAGRMVFRMLAVLAEFERETISERTRAAMGYQRTQGRRISRRIPFGYRLTRTGRLLPNPAEQKTVLTIHRMRARGLSYQRICGRLRKRGVPTKCGGGAWHPSVVRGILEREAKA